MQGSPLVEDDRLRLSITESVVSCRAGGEVHEAALARFPEQLFVDLVAPENTLAGVGFVSCPCSPRLGVNGVASLTPFRSLVTSTLTPFALAIPALVHHLRVRSNRGGRPSEWIPSGGGDHERVCYVVPSPSKASRRPRRSQNAISVCTRRPRLAGMERSLRGLITAPWTTRQVVDGLLEEGRATIALVHGPGCGHILSGSRSPMGPT